MTRAKASATVQPAIRGPASGQMLKPFALPAADDRQVRSWDYQQRRNLVLLLHHGLGCAACRASLRDLAAEATRMRATEAVLLAIGPDDPEATRQLAADLDRSVLLLSDPSGSVATRQGLTVPAVVVTDRFGEIWASWPGGDEHRLPSPAEVLDWLRYIGVQCPECGPPEPW